MYQDEPEDHEKVVVTYEEYKMFKKAEAKVSRLRKLCAEATYPEPAGSAPLVAQPPRDVSELYHELLYAVARKFPGESRHETALRYIRDTEERVCEAGSCKQNDQANEGMKDAGRREGE